MSRASSLILPASWYTRSGFQVLPIDRSEGYDVVLVRVVALALLLYCRALTPWLDSFHQPHEATPSRGIAGGLLLIICCAFSSSVMRETRSAARSAGE